MGRTCCDENPYKGCRCAYATEPCSYCEWESSHAEDHAEDDSEPYDTEPDWEKVADDRDYDRWERFHERV